jgi:hypothetical protein
MPRQPIGLHAGRCGAATLGGEEEDLSADVDQVMDVPIGVQLVSRWYDEATILRLGAALEAVSPVRDRHPDLAFNNALGASAGAGRLESAWRVRRAAPRSA